MTVDGKRFTNYSDYPPAELGGITLEDALVFSCNTAFVSQWDRVEPADLAAAAASLGLGVDHDLGFPAYFGAVPTSRTATGRAAATIGQGEVLASPMAMAAVMASVLRGRTVVPRLLPDVPRARVTAAGPAHRPGGAAAALDDGGRRAPGQRPGPGRPAGRSGARQDGHGRVRHPTAAADARVDGGGTRRPRGGGVRGAGRVGLADRRADPPGVPPQRQVRRPPPVGRET